MQNRFTVKFHAEKKYGTVSEQGIHLLQPDQRAIDDALDSIARDGFDTVHLYKDEWADLKAWTEPDSYMGPQYWGYVGVYGKHRDSSMLVNANYEAIGEELKELCKDGHYAERDEDGTVAEFPWLETAAASHWAVGWVETLLVHWTCVEALDKAAEFKDALEQYPVYKDETYSEHEQAYKKETMKNYEDTWKETVLKYLGLTRFGNKREWDQLLWALYDEECSYSGTEQAFIDVGDLERLAKTWDIKQLATDKKRPNKIAARLMQRAGAAS